VKQHESATSAISDLAVAITGALLRLSGHRSNATLEQHAGCDPAAGAGERAAQRASRRQRGIKVEATTTVVHDDR
jgi:hypothetical protein